MKKREENEMAKISAKVLSILLAAVMLVSMVPMMVSAAEAAPTLDDIVVGPEMVLYSEAWDSSTYIYEVGYFNADFVFKMEYTAGAVAKVTNSLGKEFVKGADGYYSLPLRELNSEYTYYIYLDAGDPDNVTSYELKITRLLNDEANITDIQGDGFTASLQENIWKVESYENAEELVIRPILSVGATMTLFDEANQQVEPEKDGSFRITKKTTLTAIVGAQRNKVLAEQDQIFSEWIIEVVLDHGTADCTLFSIDDAVKSGAGYVANTTNSKFLVNATISEGATYKLYKDAAFQEEILNKELTLAAKTTTVYIVVYASNGKDSSSTSLTINTTKVDAGTEAPAGELPYGGFPFLQVRGGFANILPDKLELFVPLEKGTTSFKLDAKAPGSNMVIYGDRNKISLVKNGSTIKLDGGITELLVCLENGMDSIEIPLIIQAPMVATYKDKIVNWAAPYVNGLNEMGLGLLRGDEKGNFNGSKGLNRYEMAAVMVRLSGANKDFFSGFSTPFADKIDFWAVNYVKAAYKMGLIAGIEKDGKLEFQGTKTSTRNQFLRVFMNTTLAKEGTDVDQFYAANKEAIDAFVKAKNFKDADQVAEWAKAGTYSAIYLGYIVGDEKGYINPEKAIARNEAAVILYKILGEE